MKQFLLEKINNFSSEVLSKFDSSITNGLPTTKPVGTTIKIWGDNDDGWWYLDKNSAYFFENNGVFHIIDSTRDKKFYESIVTLYETNEKMNIIRMSKPLEFDELVLENNDHPGELVNGQSLYYNKFVTPTGEYGINLELSNLLGNPISSPNEALYKFADQLIEIVKLCKKMEIDFFYINGTQNLFLLDNDGYFLFIPNNKNDQNLIKLIKENGAGRDLKIDQSLMEYVKYKLNEQT